MRFHLSKLLQQEKTTQQIVFDILQARGFLIESLDGKKYLSDNATIEDANYLGECLVKYNVGRVIDDKNYVKKFRRNWYKYRDSRSYSYLSIKPYTIEIIVFEDASVDDAITLFHDIGRFHVECIKKNLSWTQFSIEQFGPKTDVNILEPYVTYYVKAISACGVYTTMSCDGNHLNGGKVFVTSDYPSNIWHRYIWDYIVQPDFGPLPNIEDGILFRKKNQSEIYWIIYQIADSLYRHRKEIRALKAKSVLKFDKKYLHNHNIGEIEELYKSQCKSLLRTRRVQLKKGVENGSV